MSPSTVDRKQCLLKAKETLTRVRTFRLSWLYFPFFLYLYFGWPWNCVFFCVRESPWVLPCVGGFRGQQDSVSGGFSSRRSRSRISLSLQGRRGGEYKQKHIHAAGTSNWGSSEAAFVTSLPKSHFTYIHQQILTLKLRLSVCIMLLHDNNMIMRLIFRKRKEKWGQVRILLHLEKILIITCQHYCVLKVG